MAEEQRIVYMCEVCLHCSAEPGNSSRSAHDPLRRRLSWRRMHQTARIRRWTTFDSRATLVDLSAA